MSTIRCPEMDGFGKRLIDAYRQREEVMNRKGSLLELIGTAEKIAQINAKISEHRYRCVICLKMEHSLRTGPLSE